MAKKNAVAAEAAPKSNAKVGKLDKTAKVAAPAGKGKADTTESKESAPRGQYAGKKITLTDAGKAANPRGNRGLRWDIVKAGKNVNDVLGQKFTRTDGEEGTITSAGIRNFVERGFITLS